jgi:hypothetical protein
MTAHQASSALVIDGELSDWSCAQFYVLDASSAAYPPNATAKSSAAIALMWTKDTLYFAARVTDATVAGTNATQPYENDAIELYLGGGAPMGTYGANDWHFVVDYSGFARAYQGNAGAAPPQGFASSSKKTATGYVIEISVSAAVLGMGSLAAGASIGFDVQLDDCNDVDAGRAGFVEYWLAPNQLQCDACACTTMEPYCDTYAFGKVALVAP